MCASRDFDFIVFGASGFTGQYVVEYVAKIYEEENLRWAIAGRSKKKLQEVLNSVSSITGKQVFRKRFVVNMFTEFNLFIEVENNSLQ